MILCQECDKPIETGQYFEDARLIADAPLVHQNPKV